MNRTNHLLPLVLFFFSGFSGLVYEVVWVRIFGTVIGNTVLSTTAVLAAFMGGLALGSSMAGRICDLVRNPLFLYGLLEIFIGLYALALPFLIRSLVPLSRFISVLHLRVSGF